MARPQSHARPLFNAHLAVRVFGWWCVWCLCVSSVCDRRRSTPAREKRNVPQNRRDTVKAAVVTVNSHFCLLDASQSNPRIVLPQRRQKKDSIRPLFGLGTGANLSHCTPALSPRLNSLGLLSCSSPATSLSPLHQTPPSQLTVGSSRGSGLTAGHKHCNYFLYLGSGNQSKRIASAIRQTATLSPWGTTVIPLPSPNLIEAPNSNVPATLLSRYDY